MRHAGHDLRNLVPADCIEGWIGPRDVDVGRRSNSAGG